MKTINVALRLSILILSTVILSACGGGDSDGSSSSDSFAVDGGGTKGPMAHSEVMAYAFDSSNENFQGRSLQKKMGRTNDAAALTDLSLTADDKDDTPIILTVAGNDDTIDLSTGLKPQAPADITALRTVITEESFALVKAGDQPMYATPLTTVAIELAITRAGQDASKEQFETALQNAAVDVVDAFGFGMSSAIDIFLAAPLVNNQATGLASQAAIAEYRTAIETLGAIVYKLYTTAVANNPQTPVTSDQIVTALGVDLADGILNGLNGATPIAALEEIPDIAAVLVVDLTQLHVPGRVDIPLADVEILLVEELAVTGITGVDVSYLQDVIDVVPTNSMLAFLDDDESLMASDDEESGGNDGSSTSDSSSESNGTLSVSRQSGTASQTESTDPVASNGAVSASSSDGTTSSDGSPSQSGTASQPETADPVSSNSIVSASSSGGTTGSASSPTQTTSAPQQESADSILSDDFAVASTDDPVTVNGGGVKGPLAFAGVVAYAFDGASGNFQGKSLDKAETNNAAELTGLILRKGDTNKTPILLAITSDIDTIDLTTGLKPKAPDNITGLRTAVTADLFALVRADDQPIYATSLTTVAVELAIARAGAGGASAAEFEAALQVAARDVVQTLGFGMSSSVDIFLAAPLINSHTTGLAKQTAVAEYRTAVEALGAIVQELYKAAETSNSQSTVTSDQILAALGVDLADGIINGLNGDTPIAALQDIPDVASVLAVDLTQLHVPGRPEVLLTDVETILLEEMAVTGVTGVDVSYLENVIDVTPGDALLNIVADSSDKPRVVSAISTGNTKVLLTFNKPMEKASAEVSSHYSIVQANVNAEVGALVVRQAELVGVDGRAVELTTSPQNEVTYTIMVTNVRDRSGNQIDIARALNNFVLANSADFAGTPPTSSRMVCQDASNSNLNGLSCETDADCGGDTDSCVLLGSDFVDSDGDGISDDKEVRGYTIAITSSSGLVENREVTSDPYNPDTDGDGVDDYNEILFGSNPRDADTDGDTLDDNLELNTLFSSPYQVDSDGDGLEDGWEHNDFHTSVVLADTDGDKLSDYQELLELNRNPRIADLPAVNISVGKVYLQIDERFTYTDESGSVISEESSTNTSLSQSNNTSYSRADGGVTTNTFTFGSETRGGQSDQTGASDGLFLFPKGGGMPFIQTQVNLGHEESKSTSWQTDSSSAFESQRAYEASLNKAREISETRSVTREVFGASIDLDVSVENRGNLSFTINNIEISVLQRSATDSAVFLPVATLIANSQLISGTPLELNLGPFNKNKGPFLFSSRDVFPNRVEDLMRSPDGLVFKIANYDVVDEFGRNFTFSNQTVRDRTLGLLIDSGDMGSEQQFIAAAGAVSNSGAFVGGWKADGSPKGLSLDYILGEILGMPKNSEAVTGITAGLDGIAGSSAGGNDIQLIPEGTTGLSLGAVVIGAGEDGMIDVKTTVDPGDDEGYVTGYETSPTCNSDSGDKARFACGGEEPGWCGDDAGDDVGSSPACDGPEKLVRVNGLRDGDFNRAWVVMFSGDVPAPVDFGEIVVKPGEDISLAFLQDLDDDGLFARQEYLFGSIDSQDDVFDNASYGIDFDLDQALAQGENPDGIFDSKDSDGDGLGDYAEVLVGWKVSTESALYQVYSSPRLRDTDGDKLLDPQERDLSEFCHENGDDKDPRKDGLCAFQYSESGSTNTAVTDPSRADTDSDGISDGREILGAATEILGNGEEVVLGLEIGLAVVDGGNGLAETDKSGDDIQKSLVGNPVIEHSILILPGQNSKIDSIAPSTEAEHQAILDAYQQQVDRIIQNASENDALVTRKIADLTENGGDDYFAHVVRDDQVRCGPDLVATTTYYTGHQYVPAGNLCDSPDEVILTINLDYHEATFDINELNNSVDTAIAQLESTLSENIVLPEIDWGLDDDYIRSASIVVTDPLRRDTDNDTIPDGIEVAQGSDPTKKDGNNFRDDDSDGLTNDEETQLGWMVSVDNGAPYQVYSSLSLADTDDDGLPDYVERDLRTDPNKADTDVDGLGDIDELTEADLVFYTRATENFSGAHVRGSESSMEGTSPIHWDTDGDLMSDYQELYIGYRYQAPKSATIEQVFTSPLLKDSDADGASDLMEANRILGTSNYDLSTIPLKEVNIGGGEVINITQLDTPEIEADNRTDANNSDTDGDGITDGDEFSDQTDPRIPNRNFNVAMNTLYVDDVDDNDTPGASKIASHHAEVGWWITVSKFDSATNTLGKPQLLSSADDVGGAWSYGEYLNNRDNPDSYEIFEFSEIHGLAGIPGSGKLRAAGWDKESKNTCTIVPVGSLTQVHAAFNVNKALDFDLVEGDYLLVRGLVAELDTQYQDWYGCGRGPDDHTDLDKPEPSYIPNAFVGGCHDRIEQKIVFDAENVATISFDTSEIPKCDISADIVITAD